jgi:SAM-dependent methyltransferase
MYDFPDVYTVVQACAPDVVPSEVASIYRWLGEQGIRQGRILELACGTCAHGIPLAHLGHQVVGVDRSGAMLAEAGRQAVAAGVILMVLRAL